LHIPSFADKFSRGWFPQFLCLLHRSGEWHVFMGPEEKSDVQAGPRWKAFTGAIFLSGAALGIWSLWPAMQQDPFAIFIAAVVVSARYLGFGPALLCTAVSALALDYFSFPPQYSLIMSTNDAERLVIFLLVSVITAGLARQRSRAETRAEEMREKMAAIVESSDDAILSLTPDGAITSWNRGAETLYGYAASEVIGSPVSLIIPPERPLEIARVVARLNRGKRTRSRQAEHVRKDGSRVTVLVSISPLRNRTGEIVGVSAIARDVTAQQRAEEMLRRNERLTTAGRLAATIAHEINNPLEAITNLLYLARRDPEGRNEYLLLAEKEIERIAGIAHQTLGYVSEGSSTSHLNVPETMDQVLRLYMRKLHNKHIQIEKEYETGTNIHAFAGELRQLFSNLVINAVDAMQEGGKLRVRIAPCREFGREQRYGVRITIADTGSGISPAGMAHLFEPFYTTKKDSGTGLGLWLSQEIVQKHGGWMRVRSRTTPGHNGTVFSVFLPVVREEPRAA
jgi:PAS domain S-box-containing protein